MAAMQQQMSSIPQSVLQEQMRNIQNLTPEQKRMAAQQAQSFDPSTLPSQTSQFAANATQRAFMDADSLKKEGNRLHGQGQYNSAVEKYQEASLRLQGLPLPYPLPLQHHPTHLRLCSPLLMATCRATRRFMVQHRLAYIFFPLEAEIRE